ncbi:MAG: hypothetical protein ACE5HY_03775 [Candidatus Hydrothermarchaeales archaeon]
MECDKELIHKFNYRSLDDVPSMPCLDIVLYNPKNKISVADTAEIDTGLDYSVLLTGELIELLKLSFEGSEKIVVPDGSVITCRVTEVSIKIGDKWFETKAYYSEKLLTENPILGRGILNKLNLCLRGEDEESFITSAK